MHNSNSVILQAIVWYLGRMRRCTSKGNRHLLGLPLKELDELMRIMFSQSSQFWRAPVEFEPVRPKCLEAVQQASNVWDYINKYCRYVYFLITWYYLICLRQDCQIRMQLATYPYIYIMGSMWSNIKHKMEFACRALFVHQDKSWLWLLLKLFMSVVISWTIQYLKLGSGPLDISNFTQVHILTSSMDD